ncbi:MAG: hypothetical protein RIR62_2263, partial [Pseudomonadota bacterium]
MIQSATETANFLAARFARAGRPLRRDTMHRLLLLAQSWHMVSFGTELFPDAVIATPTGPLVAGLADVGTQPRFAAAVADVPARDFLDSFCQTYGAADDGAIHLQTDRDDGAWALTRLVAGDGAAIHPDLMRATFRLMLLDHADGLRRSGAEDPRAATPPPPPP